MSNILEQDHKRWMDFEKHTDTVWVNFSAATKMLFLERWLHDIDGKAYARIDRDEKVAFKKLLNEWHALKNSVDRRIFKNKFDPSRHHFQNRMFCEIKKLPDDYDRKRLVSKLKEIAQFSHRDSPPTFEMTNKIKATFEGQTNKVPSSPMLFSFNSTTNSTTILATLENDILNLPFSALRRLNF